MADFPGIEIVLSLQTAEPGFSASALAGSDSSMLFPLSLTSPAIGGSGSGEGVVAVAHASIAGALQKLFGGELFEKIIVIPRMKAAGFVLTATEFAVEVWNTFHDTAEDLTAIVVTGVGGITIVNPYTLPKTIGAKDSIILQALIPSQGDITIANDVDFVFTGILGTDMIVTGSRILVFSVAPDWQEGVEESIEYLTDVLVKYDDSEQRRGLRSIPRRGLKFRALTLNARDAAGMESLIWGWQHQPFGVPFWQDAQPLLANITAGDSSIAVSTVDRLFAVGGIALIWQDEFTFEALTIASVASGAIGTTAPTQFNWTSGPGVRIVPIFLARVSNSVEVDRNWSGSDQVDIEFAGESGQPAPAAASSPTQFKGFDVFEISPNWRDGLKRTYARSIVTLDPKTGPITVLDKGGSPVVSHDVPWFVHPHASVTALRSFLLKRLGQLVPFWCPTWDQDLVLANDVTSGSAIVNIRAISYTRFFFPNRARRFLAFIPQAGGTNRYVEVISSIDNGDGTESLTLSAPVVPGAPAATTMISFLAFSRLGADRVAIVWISSETAEAAIPIQELPRELPA